MLVDMSVRAQTSKKPPHKVNLWSKAPWDDMRWKTRSFTQSYQDNSTQHNVHQNYECIENHIKTVLEQVPNKMTRSRVNLPWFTLNLKRQCKRKQCLYSHAKKTGKPEHHHRYKEAQKSFQSDLNKAHWQYLNNNLYQSLEDGNDTSFCSYVRGQRVENVGVAPLKKGGQLHSNRKEKCEILADQFSSVFTKDCDDPYSNTALHGPSHPPICKLIIKEEGVRKLLEGTLQSPEGVGNWAGPCVHFFISAIAPYWWLAPRGGGYWTKFWRGCATGERQNPPISKGDERSRQAPCLRKLSPWRPICMDPPPNILSSPMPSQPGNCITLQIHLVSITPTIEQQLTST